MLISLADVFTSEGKIEGRAFLSSRIEFLIWEILIKSVRNLLSI